MDIPAKFPGLHPSGPISHRTLAHNFLIVSIAAVLCLPCLVNGVPPAGDSINHTVYQHHFSRQFWEGDYYPRWLTEANKGYGSPIFLIQYPLPYWVSALLRPVLRIPPGPNREAHEVGIFCFLAIAAACLAARFWFRIRCAPWASTLAAVTYICLPYILGADLYKGVEIGQLSTFACMPMALAVCDSPRMSLKRIGALGLVLALLIMSNVISAFLFLPLMLAYAIACRDTSRESLAARTVSILGSLAIGCGVAGVYLVPLLACRRLFDLSAMPRLLPGFTVSSNLLFVAPMDISRGIVASLTCAFAVALVAVWSVWRAPGSRFVRAGCLLTLGLGVAVMFPGFGEALIALSRMDAPQLEPGHYPAAMLATAALTAALAIFAYGQVAGRASAFNRPLKALLAVACGAFFLMLPWSALAWKADPLLSSSIQFPHRLCGILTVAAAGILAPAFDSSLRGAAGNIDRLARQRLLAVVVLAVLGAGVLAWRPDQPWRDGFHDHSTYKLDAARDLDIMFRTYVAKPDLQPFAALVGASLSSYKVSQTPPVDGSAALIQGQGAVKTIWQNPRTFVLDYDVPGGGVARVDQVYSPLWRAVSAGEPAPVSSYQGLMEIPLPAGRHELAFQFQGGSFELFGRLLTLVSAALVLGLLTFDLCLKTLKLATASKSTSTQSRPIPWSRVKGGLHEQ
jgi:hypothetical protein